MIRRKKFSVVVSDSITYKFLFPNHFERLQRSFPTLLSNENIQEASSRFASKKENLVLIEMPMSTHSESRKISWLFEGDFYELVQVAPVMMDGASSPVRVGDIGNFTKNLIRAWFVHDALYGLFHSLSRKKADQIFVCFAEADGTNRLARMIMHASLRMFGRKARATAPKNHWNFGRVLLTINGKEIKE